MKNRFLVLIDFSEYSGNLIRYAYDWSRQVDAELHLVHQTIVVAPGMSDQESKQQIAQQTNNEALQKLQLFANDLLPSNTTVSFSVSERHLQITLSTLLAQPFHHLLFVGIKGTGFLKKLFIGCVALQVIEESDAIVVAMPKDISSFSHEKIFVAVTEKHPFNLLQLNNFLRFINKENTSITFFYLAKPHEKTTQIEKQLKDFTTLFADRFTTTYALYEGNSPFDDIKKVINNQMDQILIVQKGSRLLTDHLFRTFLINELVYEGHTPLVVLP